MLYDLNCFNDFLTAPSIGPAVQPCTSQVAALVIAQAHMT